jgi:hypothetical protein
MGSKISDKRKPALRFLGPFKVTKRVEEACCKLELSSN